MTAKVREPNELQNIKGIGDINEEYLQEVGIQDLSDLLSTPAAEIDERLQSVGYQVPLANIEKWQSQAREMNIPNDPTLREKQKPTKVGSLASFMIEFRKLPSEQGEQVQTLVQHLEGGNKGGGLNDKWDGFAYDALIKWIREQIEADQLNLEEGTELKETKPSPPPRSTVKTQKEKMKIISEPIIASISKIQAYQPPKTNTVVGFGKSGDVFTNTIKGNQPCMLVVDLEFSPLNDATPETSLINYEIQTYITNRETGKVTQLERIKDHIDMNKELKKSTPLPVVILPPSLYRLQTILTAKSETGVISFVETPFLEIPLLEVV